MKPIAQIILECLNQELNYDPTAVDDSGREWWYVSPLYRKDQEKPDMSVGNLLDKVKELGFSSIKEVEPVHMLKHELIQIKGIREDIIKECEELINK